MEIYELDFHYHAGQERQNKSLRQHIEHAVVTGRKVLGITDHYGQYMPDYYKPLKKNVYERSFKGLRDYYNEVQELKSEFPMITLYFAPEISTKESYYEIPDEVLAMADYFICEPTSAGGTIKENTEKLIDRICETAEFSKKVNKRVFLAHPFRSSVSLHLIQNIEQYAVYPRICKNFHEYDAEEVSSFFMVDVIEVGKEAVRQNVHLEINGETQNRIRMTNLPAPLQLLWAAFALMKELGASFVPGSDQHDFSFGRHGAYVPYDCFGAIGLKAEDIKFMISPL